MKTLKFKDFLVPLILTGEKTSTWRLFDDKNLQKGDQLEFVNKDSGESFGQAVIIKVEEKRLGNLEESDFDGHEKFESEELMYKAYSGYYKKEVGPNDLVKIIDFNFTKS